jgi:hypothetical protein
LNPLLPDQRREPCGINLRKSPHFLANINLLLLWQLPEFSWFPAVFSGMSAAVCSLATDGRPPSPNPLPRGEDLRRHASVFPVARPTNPAAGILPDAAGVSPSPWRSSDSGYGG